MPNDILFYTYILTNYYIKYIVFDYIYRYKNEYNGRNQ